MGRPRPGGAAHGGPPGAPSQWWLLGLTAIAAGADAVSYLGLDRVFPANMTGNTVLLAIALATGRSADAAGSAVALGGFLLGAFAAGVLPGSAQLLGPARRVGPPQPPGPPRLPGLPGLARLAGSARWDRATAACLSAEFAVLAVFAGWWTAVGVHPPGTVRFGLVALVSAAMGMQSATVGRLGVGVSTTYITGTWTAVSTWFAERVRGQRPRPPSHRLQVGVVGCYFAAAFLAGLAFSRLR